MLYRITFKMRTPVIITDPLHLDALLMAVHPDSKSYEEVKNDIRHGRLVQPELPIQKVFAGDQYVYAASTIDLLGAEPYTGKHTKRKGGIDMFAYVSNIMTIGGMYKDNLVEDRGYIAKSASFLAVSLHKAQLLYLVQRVTHLGKNRGMGYGEVSDATVEKETGSFRDTLVKNERAIRNLPQAFFMNEAESSIIATPPYWGLWRREMGARPGDFVKLRKDLSLC